MRRLACDNNSLATINIINNSELRFLDIRSNDLSSLNTSNNVNLINLDCTDNQLETLDVTNNGDLAYLALSQNRLDNIDISQNSGLLSMSADGNELMTLNTQANISLLSLSVANNQLGSLDLTLNTDLLQLDCSSNVLTSLDLTNNTNLSELNCQANDIIDLDLKLLTKLTSVNCASNQLKSLNIKNGENDMLAAMTTNGNPDLLCIEVDDPMNIGSKWIKDNIASYNDNCHYSETYTPDDNFESALAALTGEPDNNDDYILTSSIRNLVSLDVSNSNISDLTGIEDFTSLRTLDISNNNIDSIYLNDNSDLLNFNGSANQFQKLDFSGNALLQVIDVSGNALTSISLQALTSLTSFTCNSNRIVELILTANTALASLSCAANHLELLRVNNGNNANLIIFDATENPGLMCIEIDDESSIGSSWLKDDATSYSKNCHYNETYIPDAAFEQALIDLGYDYAVGGPLDNYIPTAKINRVPILRVPNRNITDLTGIEDFNALTRLDCSGNQLNELDVTNNQDLIFLNCRANQLSQIDISLNSKIADLNISNNLLTGLDISQNPDLSILNCSSNQLTVLNILANTGLLDVNASANSLVTVEANNGYNAFINKFDLRNNPGLTCILVDNITESQRYAGWLKDTAAQYKLECNDDDNDGVADADDVCPTTPFGDRVDLFGCSVFSLPFNNFTVLTTSESCRTGNNGKINIVAAEIHAYAATLRGPIDTVVYEFFDKVEVRNVRAGTYELCITITDKPGYMQCFTLAISEPENLKVIPVDGIDGGRVAYKLSGNTTFIIEFNGLVFETEEEFIEFTLEKGRNTIRIETGAECQGFFEEVIYVSDGILLFPNPFDDYFQIVPGGNHSGEVTVNVYTASGTLQVSGKHDLIKGQVEIDVSSLPAGLYVIDMWGDVYHYRIKGIKK
ncbi:MAG: T9SS type A sorting domain-containing protein [Cyclobacteriaceae bacterium]